MAQEPALGRGKVTGPGGGAWRTLGSRSPSITVASPVTESLYLSVSVFYLKSECLGYVSSEALSSLMMSIRMKFI